MAQSGWIASDRAARLPDDWQQRRATTAERAGWQCEATMHDGTRCTARGSECDHIQHGDNHDLSNLQWLCSWHHRQKTAREAKDALNAARKANEPKPKKHPGLI